MQVLFPSAWSWCKPIKIEHQHCKIPISEPTQSFCNSNAILVISQMNWRDAQSSRSEKKTCTVCCINMMYLLCSALLQIDHNDADVIPALASQSEPSKERSSQHTTRRKQGTVPVVFSRRSRVEVHSWRTSFPKAFEGHFTGQLARQDVPQAIARQYQAIVFCLSRRKSYLGLWYYDWL